MHSELLPLLLITALAAAVPFLASRVRAVRLPIVVGEILAGMAIGQSGLDLVRFTPALTFLSDFGFAYLMFVSGLEMDFNALTQAGPAGPERPWWRRPLVLALVVFGLTLALAVAAGWGLAGLGLTKSPVLMGLILSTTSLGIVVPVLKERGFSGGPYGQSVLVGALVGDFVTLLLLSLAVALVSHGPSVDLLFVLLLLAAFGAAVQAGQWARRVPVLSRTLEELSHATAQIRVRGAFALMVAWVFLAESLGLEVILGAFLAGAFISIISGEREKEHRQKLEAVGYGFFIPVFFITVGARFDLGALLASESALWLLPLLLAAAYAVKLLPALLLRLAFPWRRAVGAGFLLSARLSLIIAAASIALELELITPAANAAVILMAIVTCTLSPVLFNRLVAPEEAAPRRGVIIVGGNQLASFLGERVRLAGQPVTYLAADPGQARRLEQEGFEVVEGGPDREGLERAGAGQARALVALDSDPEAGLAACRLAREEFQVPEVVALAEDPEVAAELEASGVRTVRPALATALALEGALFFPSSFEMLTDVSYGLELADGLMQNRGLAGRPLRRVRLPGGVLVLGVRREGEALIPHGDTSLELGDVLTLVGKPEDLQRAKAMVEGLYAEGLRSTHRSGDESPDGG
jgi:Kef-type K+ transport system membrane component KefB/K+/H+ antiporter YhaU regulatory subunit KhtT